MNGARFDVLTRRTLGIVSGGLAASLLGGAAPDDAEAGKRRKRKKRCKKLGSTCAPGGRKCCGDLRCDHHGENSVTQTFCCKTDGKSCTGPSDCCTPLGCNPETGRCDLP